MLIEVTPPASRRLTTVSTARAELRLGADVDDQRIGQLIDRASSAITGHCGQEFARRSLEQRLICEDGPSILLRQVPVVAITQVLIDGWTIPATDYLLNPASGILHWAGGGAFRDRTIVRFTAGYDLPGSPSRNLPYDIEEACLLIMGARHHGSGRDPMLRSESTEGVGSASYIATSDMSGLPPQAVDLLSGYRMEIG